MHNDIMPLSPDKTAIVFSCDDNYFKYMYVSLVSIYKTSSNNNYYDIIILSDNISENNILLLNNLQYDFFKIRIFNMENIINLYNSLFFISGNISRATYFRLFIPKIFCKYKKVLYLDCDVILLSDINELLRTDINDYLLGVVYEFTYIYTEYRKKYNSEILNIDNNKYFCSGVILYNIEYCKEFNLVEKCIQKIQTIKHPLFHDQDILNCVTFSKNKELPMQWHFMWWLQFNNKLSFYLDSNPEIRKYFELSKKYPKLIHYGGRKVWYSPDDNLASHWWSIARHTPFYEIFIFNLVNKKTIDTIEKYYKTFFCRELNNANSNKIFIGETYHKTKIFFDFSNQKIIHTNKNCNSFLLLVYFIKDNDKLYIFFNINSNRYYINSINTLGNIQYNIVPFYFSVINNSDNTYSINSSGKFISAKKDGSFSLVNLNKGWERFNFISING